MDKHLKHYLLSTYKNSLSRTKSTAKIHKKIIQNSKKIKIQAKKIGIVKLVSHVTQI